ncbi:ATP-binding domain-containing protein [Niveibacterium sp. 24ML]|nr:ATP-binding domain-containing protein [Niveibacterium sp. 24ML]
MPDGFVVFHHLHAHSVHAERDFFGEYDVVVLTPSGRVVSLEIKAGELELSGDGVVKRYGAQQKDVGKQLARQHAALVASLRRAQLHPTVNHLLVLPHHRWNAADSLSIPAERVIDCDAYPELHRRILRDEFGRPRLIPESLVEIEQHLMGHFRLVPDVDRIATANAEIRQHMASGLATWVPRIEVPSRAYVIEGAAGSGKTQLALTLLRDAASRKKRALYVCFNRTLADHVGRIAPASCHVDTLHGLARDLIERSRETVDFQQEGVFDWMIQRLAAHYDTQRGHYDLVILDEAQDCKPEWVDIVDAMGHGEHQFYVLHDEQQRLYAHERFGLEDAVQIRTRENFRSPRAIVNLINLLQLTPEPIEARGPVAGTAPGVEAYATGNDQALTKATESAVRRCIEAGYRSDQIVVLSWHGQNKSLLRELGELAGLRLNKTTGEFDAQGNAKRTPGELELETVFRFKGRSAEAVVFTEIDFDAFDPATCRRLYVGLTRARTHLELVTSNRATHLITARIQGSDR